MEADLLKTSLLLTEKERASAMPSSAHNIVTEVKAEGLHHPKEAFNRKLMVTLFVLPSKAVKRTANKESYPQAKVSSCLFQGLWKLSQEGMRTQRSLPPVGTGQRQLLRALKLQGRKRHLFHLQQAIWDTRQTAQEGTAACPHTRQETPSICPHWCFSWSCSCE